MDSDSTFAKGDYTNPHSDAEPSATDDAIALPEPASGGAGGKEARSKLDQQSTEGVYPVLPVPPPSEQYPTNTATVFPHTVRTLEFRAWEREAARLVLQHLQLKSSKFVVLMESHQVPNRVSMLSTQPDSSDPQVPPVDPGANSSPGEAGDTTAPQYAVLAEVLGHEVLESEEDDSTTTLRPMRPERDPERWVAIGLSAKDGQSPSRAELDELEQLTTRARAVRFLVQGVCRVRYRAARDFRFHITTDADNVADNVATKEELPHHPDLVLLRGESVSNALGANSLEDEIAELKAMAQGTEDSTPMCRVGGAVAGSRLDHLTDIAMEYFNELGLCDPYWSNRLRPLPQHNVDVQNIAPARLEEMADQLYGHLGEAARRQWIGTEDIGARITMLFEAIHALEHEPTTERQERVKQESAAATAERRERRERCWSADWRAEAQVEDPFCDPPNEKQRKYDRQRYFHELPQASDKREIPPVTREALRQSLDKQLFGLEEAKDAAIDRLIEQQLTGSRYVLPLCLVGPPGVGKTAFAQAVARATQRRFVEIYLPDAAGGIDLKGSEANWKSPTVGRVIKAMHEAGECNPVILLDEIDKLNKGGEQSGAGDPTPAAMEILDPNKNSRFVDALLKIPYDLSQVFFIATANVAGEIPEPLRDRMPEIIRLPGYSADEKLSLARHYLIPHIEQIFHLRPGEVEIPDETLQFVIREFCPGNGVRNLTPQLKRVYRTVLEERHGRPSRTTQVPTRVSIDDAENIFRRQGKQAFWSDRWTHLLNSLKKEDEEKRRYLRELPQPCDVGPPIEVELGEALKIMNESHHGLDKVKDRVLGYLSVDLRRGGEIGHHSHRPICLLGPPGVGKTTLCRSIAQATHRVFQIISVGGANDEYQLRGHPSKPGRILEAMLAAKRFNPLILLDEIDKIEKTPGGKQAALLEILDPEQNSEFVDHFIGLPYSLAGVLFITSANYEDNIPRELMDRLDLIRIQDYSLDDKRIIAHRYIIPRVLEELHLTAEQILFSDEAVETILQECAEVSGVRLLQECLTNVARQVGISLPKGSGGPPLRIEPHQVEEILREMQADTTTIGFEIKEMVGRTFARSKKKGDPD